MKKTIKTIAIILCLIMVTGSLAFAAEIQLTSVDMKDYEGHWAQATIQKWMDEGKVTGYPDGSYKPDGKVTRAEFVKMVNGIIDFNKKGEISYNDVSSGEWFFDNVSIAQEIGYISGYSADKFGPNDYITREQAAAILSRIQYLDNNSEGINKFSDKENISAWAKEAVGAASQAKFINGYNDGSFKPLNNLTRAEAITMLDNIRMSAVNYVVYNEGTELSDTVIEGDLIIAKTVGDGEVYIENVEIKGTLYVYGGGENSLYFNNIKVSKIIVDKDKVRLVLDNGSVVEEIEITSQAILENTNGTIAKISISGDNEVVLSGAIEEVTVVGNSKITLNNAVITKIIVNQPVVIEGTGTIKTLEANADGIKFVAAIKIDKTVVGAGVTVKPAAEVEEIVSSGGGGTDTGTGTVTVTNPSLIITINITGRSPIVLNTDDFSEDDTIYDALVGILNDDDYESVISEKLDSYSIKLDEMQVGTATGRTAIWNKFASYLPDTMDVSGLKTGFTDGTITISELNSLLAVYENASSHDLSVILTNLGLADFNNASFKYNDNIVTYTVTSEKGTMPEGNIEIANFILNEILISNKTIGEFFDSYGTITFTSTIQGTTVKTATITIESN